MPSRSSKPVNHRVNGGVALFVDPEVASPDALGAQGGSVAKEIAVAARKDYVDVAPSTMRKNLPLSISQMPRYKGKKVTRAQLDELEMDDSDVSDSEVEESGGGESDHTRDSDDESDEDGEDDEDDEDGEDGEDKNYGEDDVGFETGESTTENEPSAPSSAKRKRSNGRSDKDNISAPKKKNRSNAMDTTKDPSGAEPAHVRNHLSLLEALLEYRIVAQRALSLVGRLPPPSLFPAYSQLAGSGAEETRLNAVQRVVSSIEGLITIRRSLLSELPVGISGLALPAPPADNDDLDRLRQHLASLDDAFKPYRTSELRKWDQRSTASAIASKGIGGLTSGLKIFGKKEQGGVVERIDAALAEREKLLAKTRVRREGQDTGLGRLEDTQLVVNAGDSKAQTATDLNLFDDAELYSYLLRDLIDRKSTDGASNELASTLALSRPAKVSRLGVDRKASKGRRLRYKVHEKLVGFMVPRGDDANVEGWDWVSRTLFGQGNSKTDMVDSVDGLKVIG
ncbi:hypothetical protein M427DRAFT_138380 [Gonapodya prolifera JEL478]|uniref:Protein BFR2 n=1 Tax=Gonapodya prolifera (strain JEL478) TaxID=1344416 RepID=A0A139A3A7_GONPJ|nr:hypothetical protein M427DRAFT_138380 [Gonapodya prolifera JEL478]|eukprot:KXS11297.1 hypothetical protein M427DRAFT_138380 [Gonapodya prolifera JEL478]